MRATGRSVRVSDVAPLAALGLCAGPLLLAPLQQAGLASVAAAVVLTGVLAIPTARIAWADALSPLPLAFGTLRLWGAFAFGALLGPRVALAGMSGWLGLMLGLVVLPVVVALRPGVRLPFTVLALLGVFLSVLQGDPGGAVLLEPSWGHLREWLPVTASWAALVSGVGFGLWSELPHSAPGRRRLYALPAGIAGVGLVAQSVAVARAWGQDDLLHPLLWQSEELVYVAAVSVALTRPNSALVKNTAVDRLKNSQWRTALTIGATTAWFAGPAASAVAAWWSSMFLLGPALICGLAARRSTGNERLYSGALTLGWLTLALLGWPGLPKEAVGAAALAALPVLVIWTAGTRAVVRTA